VWTSLWGRFGYGQIPLPSVIYGLLGAAAVVSLAGLFIPLLRRNKVELVAYGPYLLILLANVAIFFAVIFNYLLVSPAGPMGRFFFPALPSLALLIIYGLSCWLALLPAADSGRQALRGRIMSLLVAGGLLLVSLIALFGYLAPAYAHPPAFEEADLRNKSGASFAGLVALQGYEISRESLAPGEDLEVTLYWEVTAEPPGDYLQFVHLIDEQGLMIAQRDTHPGLGRFPSSQWQVGDRFVDTVVIDVPEVAYAPALGMVSTGFYAPQEGYRLGVNAPDGAPLGDALELGEVAIVPAPEPDGIPNAQRQNFADELLLRGYSYDQRQLKPGQPLGVTLYWQALAEDIPDYEVQLRLLDESGWIMETLQERPLGGSSSMADWKPGEIVVDRHELYLNPSIMPGVYRVQLALQRVSDNERPVIVDENGRWLSDKLPLAELLVVP
jgi:hypothetical protein